MSEWKRLRAFSTPNEAQIAEGVLLEYGIVVRAGNESAASILSYAPSAFQVELWTSSDQVEEATQILDEFDRQKTGAYVDPAFNPGASPAISEKQKQFRRAYQTGILGTFFVPGIMNLLSVWFWIKAYRASPKGFASPKEFEGKVPYAWLLLSTIFNVAGVILAVTLVKLKLEAMRF